MRYCTWLGAGLVLLATAGRAGGDVVRVAGGGSLRGEVLDAADGDGVAVRTVFGAVVVLPRDQVIVVEPRPPEHEWAYERLRAEAGATAADQWRAAQWCLEHGFTAEQRVHLERTIELDPDHAEARRLLGYVREGDRWLTRDDRMRERGYVRYEGRWMLPQERDLLVAQDDFERREREWFQQVRTWVGWMRNPQRGPGTEAEAQLHAIDDAAAIPALMRFLGQDEDERLRRFLVALLSEMTVAESTDALVQITLSDPTRAIAYEALERLKDRRDPRAVELYIAALRSEDNRVVRGAAIALGELGDPSAIEPLIDSLVTEHRARVTVPQGGGYSVTFGSGGSTSLGLGGGGPGPMITPIQGFGPTIIQAPMGRLMLSERWITVPIQNREVVTALEQITGVSFGYDREAWQGWWLAAQQPEQPLRIEQP